MFLEGGDYLLCFWRVGEGVGLLKNKTSNKIHLFICIYLFIYLFIYYVLEGEGGGGTFEKQNKQKNI